MRYPYPHIRREGAIRYLPLVPVMLRVGDNQTDVLALVDSGAEQNIFHVAVAEDLGINLASSREVMLISYSGQQTPGYLLTIELQLGRYRWQAPAIFFGLGGATWFVGPGRLFRFFQCAFQVCSTSHRYSTGRIVLVGYRNDLS